MATPSTSSIPGSTSSSGWGRCWRSGAGVGPTAVSRWPARPWRWPRSMSRRCSSPGCGRARKCTPAWPAPAAATPCSWSRRSIANPLRREVIVDLGDRYEKGFVDFSPGPHFRPAGYGVEKRADDPLAAQASRSRIGQQYPRMVALPVLRRRAHPDAAARAAERRALLGSDGHRRLVGDAGAGARGAGATRAAIGPVEWTSCPG